MMEKQEAHRLSETQIIFSAEQRDSSYMHIILCLWDAIVQMDTYTHAYNTTTQATGVAVHTIHCTVPVSITGWMVMFVYWLIWPGYDEAANS